MPNSNVIAMPSVAKADFETRNNTLIAMAAMAGLRLPETRLPPGTALLQIGEENKRALAKQVKDLPDLHDGLAALVHRIGQEKHVDTPVLMSKVRMNPSTGALYGQDILDAAPMDKKQDVLDAALAYTKPGFSHVTQIIKPPSIVNGFAENMLALPPKLQSEVFNHWAGMYRPGRDEKKHFIRTLVHPESGRRLIRAVTSDIHSLKSGDDLTIASVLAAMPKGGKLRITRTMDRTDFEIIWPAMDRELVVGDVALMALTITNSETKGLSLRIEPKLLRVLCYNFTTAYTEGGEEEISLKHVGDLSKKLPAAIKKAKDTLEPFIHAFSDAYQNEMPRTRAEIAEALTKKFKAQLPETTMSRALELWDVDGVKGAGDTLAGLVNALTRASQEQSMAAAAETERIAGKLVVGGWGVALS